MRKNRLISEAELSYEELKCLEAHFRQQQNEAIVSKIKKAPSETMLLLAKLLSTFKSSNNLKMTETEPFD